MTHSNFWVCSAGDLLRQDCSVLRPRFSRHHLTIKNGRQLRATLRAGKFTDLGGYPLYLFTSDGAALCFDCARANLREITGEIRRNYSPGWRVVGCDVNWEDCALRCDHCGELIPSAHGDDDDESGGCAE